MNNTLGELFSGIAEAIRYKTGTTDVIKPTEFAERINGITVENLRLMSHIMVFNAETTTMTFSHNLGKIPDIIIIWPNEPPTQGYMTMAIGFSQAFTDIITNSDTDYPSRAGYYVDTSTGGSSIIFGSKYGFDNNVADNRSLYGLIRNVTTSTLTVGQDGSYIKLKPDVRYTCSFITGLFS